MKKSSRPFIALGVINIMLGAAVIPNCINIYKEHKHSKETLKRWSDWRKTHPNWQPPKNDVLKRFNIACGVEPEPVPQPSIDLDLPTPLIGFDRLYIGEDLTPEEPTLDLIRPEPFPVFDNQVNYGTEFGFPNYNYVGIGGYPSQNKPIAPTPESESIVLVCIGFGLITLVNTFEKTLAIFKLRSAAQEGSL